MPVNMIGIPGQTYQALSTRYIASGTGFIANVANNDTDALLECGCIPVGVGMGGMIGKLIGANMNITTDQPISMFVPAGASYALSKITASNASISLTTAAGGIYTSISKTGTIITPVAQAYSALTGSTVYGGISLVAAQTALAQTANPLYLSLTTGQGAAATLDIYLWGDLLV